jgi:glucose/arabinose dehydrogenase
MKVFIAGIILLVNCTVYPQSGLFLTQVTSGLTHPVSIANAGDSRLFIVEQPGIIRIMDTLGNISLKPFLDIVARVKSTGTEQGLLGLAFHPEYSSNRYFYVNYTGLGDSTHISRFSVSPQDPDSAVPSIEKKIMTLYQPFINHNGGELQFGPDGYLYIGLGDGGWEGDPNNLGQDSTQLLGKILRVDVNAGDPYSIPLTNPFVGHPGVRPEIWATGLRNPWRFSFDNLTGDLWIGDVGQDRFEEIDYQPASSSGGENYGWRCYEADSAYNLSGCGSESNYTFPVASYPHMATDPCEAVTGGYVYRGSRYPVMYGYYFYADYCTDKVWAIKNTSGTWVNKYVGQFGGNNFSTFGEDWRHELYVAGRTSGRLYRLGDTTSLSVSTPHENNFRITPNPAGNEVSVELSGNFPLPCELEIIGLSGKVETSTTLVNRMNKFDLSGITPGVYILRFRSGSCLSNEKLMIIH